MRRLEINPRKNWQEKMNQMGFIYQDYCQLPEFGGKHAVIGSWIIGEEAGGIGIREDSSLITRNLSQFVPHFIGEERGHSWI